MDINSNIKGYFDSHPAVNEFLFTSDGIGFFTNDAAHANAHAGNLRQRKLNDKVETVKRGDVDAWWATEAPAVLQRAEDALAAAQKAYDEAEGKLKGLAKNAPVAQRGAANRAVEMAKKGLEAAERVAEKAKADVEALAAEQKLAADKAAGADAGVIAADAAAVETAKKKGKK